MAVHIVVDDASALIAECEMLVHEACAEAEFHAGALTDERRDWFMARINDIVERHITVEPET